MPRSPTRLTNTACQHYFLLLGRLSRTEAGRSCLERHRGLALLSDLLRHTVVNKISRSFHSKWRKLQLSPPPFWRQPPAFLMRHNQIQILGCIVLTAVARLRHELYLKLVVTALDYSTEDTRQLLVRALTQATEPGRVYATRWLGVLARYKHADNRGVTITIPCCSPGWARPTSPCTGWSCWSGRSWTRAWRWPARRWGEGTLCHEPVITSA